MTTIKKKQMKTKTARQADHRRFDLADTLNALVDARAQAKSKASKAKPARHVKAGKKPDDATTPMTRAEKSMFYGSLPMTYLDHNGRAIVRAMHEKGRKRAIFCQLVLMASNWETLQVRGCLLSAPKAKRLQVFLYKHRMGKVPKPLPKRGGKRIGRKGKG